MRGGVGNTTHMSSLDAGSRSARCVLSDSCCLANADGGCGLRIGVSKRHMASTQKRRRTHERALSWASPRSVGSNAAQALATQHSEKTVSKCRRIAAVDSGPQTHNLAFLARY